MIASLTKRQADALAFIETYLVENKGVGPSLDEIRDALDLSSKSRVHELVAGLELRGHLRRIPKKARAIELFTPPSAFNLAALSDSDLNSLGARVAAECQRRAAA